MDISNILVDMALRRMKPAHARALRPCRAAFRTAAESELLRYGTPERALAFLLRLAPVFLNAYRALLAVPLPESDREGTCLVCLAPEPPRALPCCGAGVHAECWAQWRLVGAPRCPHCGATLSP